MKKLKSRPQLQKLRRFKRVLQFLAILIFILFEAYYIYIQNQPPAETLIDLSIGILVALLLIEFGFRYAEKYQIQLDEQLKASQAQSQRYAALAQLSTELAAILVEEKIYHKLIQELHNKLGYDYVAIFLVDQKTGERVLPSGGSIGWPDITPNWRIPPGEGLSERPLLDEKLHYSPNVKLEPGYIPGLNQGSEVDVPLRVADEVLGVLVVESRETHAFDDDDFRILTTAANQAAIAIYNARLLVDEKTQKRQAETLRAATIALTAALNLDQVLDQLLVRIKEVVPYDSASVFLLKENSTHHGVNRLQVMATKGLPYPERILGHDFPGDDPLFLETKQRANPVILEDAQNDPRYRGWGDTSYVRGWMGVPLIARGEVIGYLSLDSHKVGTYSENQAHLAQAFANQAALAIDNARLYQSARQAAERRVILHQASQEIISASLKPEKIYQAIHQAASELMPTEVFIISILDRKEEIIDLLYLVDRKKRSPPIRIPKDQGLSGHVIGSGENLMINDYRPETQEFRVVRFGSLEQVRSILAVPMRLGDTAFGMLSAQSYHVNVYEEEDKHLLEMLAAHAAIALDNARLFREVQRLAIT
ncbi:MAG: GAF domain-containing protein, partial [Anaerolineales bacterium]